MGKMNNTGILWNVVLIVICIAIGWFLKTRLTPPMMMGAMGGAAATPMVLVETVTEEDITPSQSVIGHIEAINSVNLQPQVSGYLENFTFAEGSVVNQGDVLFVIERQRYQAVADLRQAELDAARASLNKIQKDYNRQKSLNQQKFASEAKLDEAYSSLLQARAAVKMAQANYELAKIDLEHAEIKAPFSGKIGKAKVTEGNFVSSATGVLASIVQFDPVRITFSLTDKQITAMRHNGIAKQHINARIELPDGKIVRMTSVDEYADNSIDANTATVAVYAEFANPDELLIPGGYVNLNIDSGNPVHAITVSQAAVGQDQHGNYVMVVGKDNTARQRRVKLGETVGKRIIIAAGLNNGEHVIVQGMQKVSDGSVVRAENINAEEK